MLCALPSLEKLPVGKQDPPTYFYFLRMALSRVLPPQPPAADPTEWSRRWSSPCLHQCPPRLYPDAWACIHHHLEGGSLPVHYSWALFLPLRHLAGLLEALRVKAQLHSPGPLCPSLPPAAHSAPPFQPRHTLEFPASQPQGNVRLLPPLPPPPEAPLSALPLSLVTQSRHLPPHRPVPVCLSPQTRITLETRNLPAVLEKPRVVHRGCLAMPSRKPLATESTRGTRGSQGELGPASARQGQTQARGPQEHSRTD